MGDCWLHGTEDICSELVSWYSSRMDSVQRLTLPAVAQVQLLASASGEPVSSVAWSQKGTFLAAGGDCGAVSVYDAATVSAPAGNCRAPFRRSQDARRIGEKAMGYPMSARFSGFSCFMHTFSDVAQDIKGC